MLKIPENAFFPKNLQERENLDKREKGEMDLFQEMMRNDLERITVRAIEPTVPYDIFPISQKASEYSDIPYGKVSTIGDGGCGPLAMEYAIRVNGFNVDFKELVEEISKKGYRGYIYDEDGNIVDGCGTEYSLFDNMADKLYNVSQILNELKKSVICILIENSVYNQDPKRKGNHFITIIGIDENENAIFMDGNLITDSNHPEAALVKKPFRKMALGFRGAWAWNKEKMEMYLK